MSLSQLNSSICLRATQRQDIPIHNGALLPQTDRPASPRSTEALQPSLFPWGYTPLSFWHKHPIYGNVKLKQGQGYSAARQPWHIPVTVLIPLSSPKDFVKNVAC